MMQIWLPKSIISTDEEDNAFLNAMSKNMNTVRRQMLSKCARKDAKCHIPTRKIIMPKFSINFRENIKSALEKLGIVDVFGPMSDLSPMLGDNQQAAVKKVNHVVKFDVDEDGVEGSAVTTIDISK